MPIITLSKVKNTQTMITTDKLNAVPDVMKMKVCIEDRHALEVPKNYLPL
jgi:hypothetical protein